MITPILPADESDQVVGLFLELLARDIQGRERLASVDSELVERARLLVAEVEVNLNEPLSTDDE